MYKSFEWHCEVFFMNKQMTYGKISFLSIKNNYIMSEILMEAEN